MFSDPLFAALKPQATRYIGQPGHRDPAGLGP